MSGGLVDQVIVVIEFGNVGVLFGVGGEGVCVSYV